jgi:hypothetical protein
MSAMAFRALQAPLIRPAQRALNTFEAQTRIAVGDGRLRGLDLLHLHCTGRSPRKSHGFTEAGVRDHALAGASVPCASACSIRSTFATDCPQKGVGLPAAQEPHVATGPGAGTQRVRSAAAFSSTFRARR